MSYKINTLPDIKTIKVTVDGPITLFEKEKAYTEAFNELFESSYHRILFDSGNGIESKNHTTGETIDIFNDLKKRQNGKKIKLAFLTKDSTDKHTSYGILLKTIANINGKHFTRSKEAIKWLCQDDSL